MHHHPIAPFPDSASKTGVYVADGYGIKIRVNRRHLIVEDGFGSHRRTRRFHKATTNLRRLVVLGHTGYITFEAIRWLTDANIPYLHLDHDGTVLATSNHRRVDNAKLRRAQAVAAGNQIGRTLTRTLLQQKLEGQTQVATRLPNPQQTLTEIGSAKAKLETATSLDRMREAEAAAAIAYWTAWSSIPIRFARKDTRNIPDHWHTFGTRRSPIVNGNRKAANPINTILNYLYALLEAEARIAATYVGLDPAIGILHADQPARDSLALDLMEPARPAVDDYLLDLLDGHVFRAADFHETRQGVCRLLPPLTHVLGDTTAAWATAIAPIAEQAALLIAETPGLQIHTLPTPLTQTKRSAGRSQVRSRPAERPTASPRQPEQACIECGTAINTGQKRCSPCNGRYQQTRSEALHEQRLTTLAQLRDAGEDPAHGGEAARRRAQSMLQQRALSAEWDANHTRPDPEIFRTDILPGLANVTLRDMMRATGLSSGYCSMIRRGKYTPHPRHWKALTALIAPDGQLESHQPVS